MANGIICVVECGWCGSLTVGVYNEPIESGALVLAYCDTCGEVTVQKVVKELRTKEEILEWLKES